MDSYSGNPADPLSLNLYTYCHNNPVYYIDPSGHDSLVAQPDIWGEVLAALAKGATKIGIGAYQVVKAATPIAVGIWVWNKNSIDAGGDLTQEQLEQISRVENKQEPYIFVLEQPDGSYILIDFNEVDEAFKTEGTSILEEDNYIYTSPMDRQQTLRVLYAIKKAQDKASEPTSPSQLQQQVQKGQAPKEVDRVDKPHVHLKDGTSLNNDGTIHDAHKGNPNPSNKTTKWLLENGWEIGDIK